MKSISCVLIEKQPISSGLYFEYPFCFAYIPAILSFEIQLIKLSVRWLCEESSINNGQKKNRKNPNFFNTIRCDEFWSIHIEKSIKFIH